MAHFIRLGYGKSPLLLQRDRQAPYGPRPANQPSADQPSHRLQAGGLYVLERDQDVDDSEESLLDQEGIETLSE